MTNVSGTITPHHARMFLKISRAVGCVILNQMSLYYPNGNFFGKLNMATSSNVSSCQKNLKKKDVSRNYLGIVVLSGE